MSDDLLAEFVSEATEHLGKAEALLLALCRSEAPDAEGVNACFRSLHTVKGLSGFLDLNRVKALAHGAEQVLDALRAGRLAGTPAVWDQLLGAVGDLAALIAALGPGGEPAGDDAPRLVALERLLAGEPPARIGDLLAAKGVPRAAIEAAAQQPGRLGDNLVASGAASRSQVEQAAAAQGALRADATTRVATARLEHLVELVGELTVAQALVSNDGDVRRGSRLAQGVARQGRILRTLQDLALSLRLVPLRGAFQKLARAVHDTARKVGKDVQFTTRGEDTEIDRALAEALADPLLHMVRNAVDHGIEPAEARIATGKPARGTVTLGAAQAGDDIVITLADDGGGMDPQRLRAKAIAKGLIPADRALSDAECFALIFLPGFSTAAQVTEVSGRGVGMDVVRRQVEAANGQVAIASAVGAGTTFTIRLPLTTAILDALLIAVGGQQVLLPLSAVLAMHRPQEHELTAVLGRGHVAAVRGRHLPVVELGAVLAAPAGPGPGILLVVEQRGEAWCLRADAVLGLRQVVAKPLDTGLTHPPWLSGAAILGDGRVALILNPARLAPQPEAACARS
jgi:two-component system chemotaxis sensor kinase CheA